MSLKPGDTAPTTIDRKPTKEVIESERRFVESAQLVREIHRDSWMTDDEALRFHCINAAITAKGSFNFEKDNTGQAQAIIDMADDFFDYVRNGTSNTVAP